MMTELFYEKYFHILLRRYSLSRLCMIYLLTYIICTYPQCDKFIELYLLQPPDFGVYLR